MSNKEADTPVYDVNYFIEKFTKIPDELWTTYNFELDGRCCALGFCGTYFDKDSETVIWNDESQALKGIFGRAELPSVSKINDCIFDREFTQKHPKYRILHALQMIKKKVSIV